MKGPASFQGFQDPPAQSDPNASSWRDRAVALGTRFPDQWAKYGPYASNKTASHASTSAREALAELDGVSGDVTYGPDDDGSYYVFMRAVRAGSRDSNVVSPMFREAQ
jgi:hypothetical protein